MFRTIMMSVYGVNLNFISNSNFYLNEIHGGDKHNAIPRESYAKTCIKNTEKAKFISDLKAEETNILGEIKPIDPNLKIDIEK